jgi:hypothetical protein
VASDEPSTPLLSALKSFFGSAESATSATRSGLDATADGPGTPPKGDPRSVSEPGGVGVNPDGHVTTVAGGGDASGQGEARGAAKGIDTAGSSVDEPPSGVDVHAAGAVGHTGAADAAAAAAASLEAQHTERLALLDSLQSEILQVLRLADPVFLYSTERGLLDLSDDVTARLALRVVTLNVTDEDDCFGGEALRAWLSNVQGVGADDFHCGCICGRDVLVCIIVVCRVRRGGPVRAGGRIQVSQSAWAAVSPCLAPCARELNAPSGLIMCYLAVQRGGLCTGEGLWRGVFALACVRGASECGAVCETGAYGTARSTPASIFSDSRAVLRRSMTWSRTFL